MTAPARKFGEIDGIARALHGRRQGRDSWLCRCPLPKHGRGKGDRNPSLSICQRDQRLLLHCFGGCDGRDVFDELKRRGWIENFGARIKSPRRPEKPQPAYVQHEPDRQAVALWRLSIPITGTLAAAYLRGRGLPVDVPSLRFLPSYPVGRRSYPAMVAAVQAPDRRVVAVQLTFLDAGTAKKATLARPRKTIGLLGEGAVRLGPAGPMLGLAEGTESALGAMRLAKVPTWAALGKRLHRVALPPEVKTVHIFADDDEPGHKAAREAAANQKALGREVAIRLPAAGMSDWAEWAATPIAGIAP